MTTTSVSRRPAWGGLALLPLLTLLAACGGGGGDGGTGEGPAAPPPERLARACTPEAFADLQVAGAELKTVAPIAAGTHRGQANLPAFCLITASAHPTSRAYFSVIRLNQRSNRSSNRVMKPFSCSSLCGSGQ